MKGNTILFVPRETEVSQVGFDVSSAKAESLSTITKVLVIRDLRFSQ